MTRIINVKRYTRLFSHITTSTLLMWGEYSRVHFAYYL